MTMPMPYKALLLPLAAIPLYLASGAFTSCYLRATNPLYGSLPSSKTLYLTFDDGIDPRYTPMLLDLLKQHNIKASFFVLASSAKEHPSILRRIKEDGHLIGLHSLSHKNQILQLPIELRRDFTKSLEIFRTLGIDIAFYRPPWGHVSAYGLYLCNKYKLNIVLWTAIVGDWKKNTTVDILCDKLSKAINDSAVICLHDGRGRNQAPLKTLGALKKMIPKWKKDGYVFETVSQLF